MTSVRFSPDGSTIAALDDTGIGFVWALPSGAPFGHFSTQFAGVGNDVAYSPNARWLAATGSNDVLLDARSLQPRYAIPPEVNLYEYDIAFSPDGTRFAAAGGDFQAHGRISVRDATTGYEVAPTISTGTTTVGLLAYSPDGRTIAGARTDGSISVWDASSGRVLRDGLVGATRAPIALAFVSGSTLVEVTTAEIVVLDPNARLGSEIAPANGGVLGYVNSLAVSPDGRTFASADGLGRIRVWDMQSGALQRSITVTSSNGTGAMAIAYRPGTHTIVVGAGDGTVSAWDANSGRRLYPPIRLTEPNAPATIIAGRGVFAVAFDAHGATLAALAGDGSVAFIDPQSWRLLHRVRLVDNVPWGPSLALSPDGQTVAAGAPGTVVIAERAGTRRRLVDIGALIPTSLVLQPKGNLIAVGLGDGRVLLADPTTARVRTTLVSNHGAVESLVFDATGHTLAVGGRDGTVTLWNVARAEPTGPPLVSSQQRSILAVKFAQNDTTLIAADSGGTIVRYELQPPRWIDRLCALAARNLTRAEWDRFMSPAQTYRPTCSKLPAGT